MQPSTVATVVSSVSFLGYGASLCGTRAMVPDFERYGLSRQRILVGVLQMAAGIGLLVGLRVQPLLVLSAGGLALMMLVAVVVRLRVGDPPGSAIPALLLCGLNVYIVVAALQHGG